MKRRLRVVLAATIVIAVSGGFQSAQQTADLFHAVEWSGGLAEPVQGYTVRWRPASIDRVVLETARADLGRPGASSPMLRLNLFDDVVLATAVDHSGPTASGYTLSGRIGTLGSMTLVVNGDVIAGTVRTSEATYLIRSLAAAVVAIQQVDLSTLPPEGEPLLSPRLDSSDSAGSVQPITLPTPLGGNAADPSTRGAEADDGSVIDVAVFYTPAARNQLGGTAQIEAEIDLMMTATNRAYSDSWAIQRVRLVSRGAVDYSESSSVSTDLNRLRESSDGYMDEIHAIRDRDGADLVHMIVDTNDDTCGRAWISVTAGRSGAVGHSEFGFGISDVACAAPNFTFAHELGHNMGLLHDRYVYTPERRESSPYSFGFGYVNQRAFEPGAPGSSHWRTIMAYNRQCDDADFYCSRLPFFSNHEIFRAGDPLGVSGLQWSRSQVGPADTRRALNLSRSIIANYRTLRRRETCLGAAGPPTITLQASNGQYFVAEGGGGGAVSANRSAAGAWEQFQVTDPSGGCVTSGDAVFFRTYGSFYLRAELGGGSTLDAAGAAAGAWEQFVIRNQGGGDVFDGDLVTLQAPSGHYVVAEGGGGGVVLANRPAAGLWESFRIGNAN